MAVSSFLALLDDVAAATKVTAASLDDVASLTVQSSQKATGIVVDDMGVTAGGMVGMDAKRELPVVKAVALGSLKNKFFYLIPGALGLSVAAPGAIAPLLMAGGAFLCYEGMGKVLGHGHGADEPHLLPATLDPVVAEKEKIAQAIKTDVVLSGEIVAMTLGMVTQQPLLKQALVLGGVGAAMTVGVYGMVAGLVKMDDAGLALARKQGDGLIAQSIRKAGRGIVQAAPHVFKGIGAIGTGAMLYVGAGILAHNIAPLHHAMEAVHAFGSQIGPYVGGAAEFAATLALGAGVGAAAQPLAGPLEKAFGALGSGLKAVSRPVVKAAHALRQKLAPAPVAEPQVSVKVASVKMANADVPIQQPVAPVAPVANDVSPTRQLRALSPQRELDGPPRKLDGASPSRAAKPGTGQQLGG